MNIEQIISNGDSLVPPDITDFYQSGKTIWCFWLHYDKKFEQVEDDVIVTVSWRLKYGNDDVSQTFSNHKKIYTIEEFATAYDELKELGNQDIVAFKMQCNKVDGVFLVTENNEGAQEIPGILYGTDNKSLVISATNVPVVKNLNLGTLLSFKNSQAVSENDDITFVGTPYIVPTDSITGNSLLITNGEYFSVNDQLLGGKSFTVDFFVCPNNVCPNNSCICDIAHPNGDIKVKVLIKDDTLTLGFFLDNRPVAQTKDDIIIANTLVHVAIVYSVKKSFLYFFVNGNLVGNINVTLTEKIVQVWFNRDITSNTSTFIGTLDQVRVQENVAVWIPNQPYQDYETQVVDDIGAVWQMHNGVVTVAPEGKGRFPGKTPGTTTGLWFNNVEDPEKYPDGICKLKYQNDVTYAELVTPIKLGAADFTIDFWAYFDSLDHVKSSQASGAFEITMTDPDTQQKGILGCHYVYSSSIGYKLCIHGSGVTNISNVRAVLDIQTLCHIAIVFTQDDGKLSVFVDGKKKKSVVCAGLQRTEYDFHLIVGRYYDNVGNSSNGPLDGSIDEFRISAGVARWTEDFEVPTEPYEIDQYTKALMRTSSFGQEEQEGSPFETVNPNKTFNPPTEPYVNKTTEQQVSSSETADFRIPLVEYFDDDLFIPIKQLPVQTAIPLYDGETIFEPIWLNYDPQALRLEGDISSSEPGIHYVTFTPIDNHVWWNGSTSPKTVSWKIISKPLDYPTVTGDLTYNGIVQTIPISGFDEEGMILEGATTAADSNTLNEPYYIATVRLKPGYSWTEGGVAPYELRWKIKPLIVEKPVLNQNSSLTFVYNGTEQRPVFNYDSSLISAIGTTAATVPNMTNKTATLLTAPYEFAFSLKDKRNFRWSSTVDQDGGIENIPYSWYIKRKPVATLTITNMELVYNTMEQSPDITPSVWNSDEITVSGNKATVTGNYKLIFQLTDVTLYEWSTGATEDLVYQWSIIPAVVGAPVLMTQDDFVYDGTTKQPTFSYDNSLISQTGTIAAVNPNVTNKNKQLLTGATNYTITFSLKDKTNYVWTNNTTTDINHVWFIRRKVITKFTITDTSFVYNTQEQGPTLNPSVWNTAEVTVTDSRKTTAGSYTLVCTLTDISKYEWSDGSTANLTQAWTINKKPVTIFAVINNSLTYNTLEQGPVLTPATWDSAIVTITNNRKTTVGSYTIVCHLVDITNYEWTDGSTADKTYDWNITPAQLKEPIATSSLKFVYDTTMKTPTFAYDNTLIAVNGDINKTNPNYTNKTEALLSGAKDYVVTFSLKDKINYVWETTKNTVDITRTWIIKRKPISKFTIKNTTFTYNTKEQQLDLTPSSWNSSEVIVTGNKGTVAQSYTLTCKLQNTSLYEWDDGTIADIVKDWIINPQAIDVPILKSTSSLEFTYDNTSKQPVFTYDDTLISTSGNTDAVLPNVTYKDKTLLSGKTKYNIVFTLKDKNNYVWSNGTTANITETWCIKRKPITKFTIKNTTFTYNTKQQGPTLTPNSWDENEVTVTDNKGTNVKSYALTCHLKTTTLYEWSDGTTADITQSWTITPQVVNVPILATASSLDFTYDTTEKAPAFTYDTALISVIGTTKATVPNVTYKDKALLSGKTKYDIVFALKDKNNYVWSSNTINDITKTWYIRRKPVTKVTVTNITFTYNGKEQGPTLSSYNSNEVTVTGNKGTAAKSYTLTCQLKDTALYEWSDGTTANITQNWSISVYEVEVPVYQTDSVNEYKTLAGFATYDAAKRTISCTYDNTKKTPLFTYDANYITKSGITNATAANYSNILQQLLGDTKYLITFTLKDKTNYRWKTLNNVTDITFELIIKRIAVTKIVISNTALTYKVNANGNGVQQSVVLTPALGSGSEVHTPNTTRVSVTGNTATNAGTYTAICTLKNTDKYEWDDGTIAPIEKQWTISPKSIAIPTATSLEFTYDPAQEQGPTLSYDTQFVQVSGTQKATNANFTNKTKKLLTGASNYVITFALKDTANFKWSNNTTAAISSTWFIKRQLVPIITFKNLEFIYNPNKDQGPTLSSYNSDIVTVTNNSKRDAGSYTVKCHLADSANYEWNDGTTADITQSWSIAKANGSISLSGKYNGKAVTGTLRLVASETVKKPTMTFTVSRLGTGKVTCTTNSNLEITVAANYSTLTVTGKIDTNEQPVALTITAAADNNYNAATTELNVIVVIGLEMFSWTEIADMAADGTLLNYCKIGDYKTIPTPSKFTINTGDTTSQLNTEEKSLKVVLIGYNHNSAVEGQRVAHFMFGKLGEGRNLVLPNTKVPLFTTTTNSDGWNNTYIKDALTDSSTSICYENLFPDELMGVMKPFVKWTDNIGGGINKASYVTPSLEYVSLLSEYEVFGTNTYGSQGEALHQKQYDYFKNSNVLQRYRNDNTASNGWALRTVNATDNKKMVYVKPNGTVGTCDISTCLDVPFIFAVSKKQIGTITVPSVAISIETLMHFDDPNDPFKDECNTQFVAKSIKNDEIIAPDISDSPAKFNKAIQFNNTNYIQQTKGIMLGGKDFTIDFWIYVDKDTNNIDGEIGNLLQMRSTSFNLYWRRAIQSPTAEANTDKRLNTMIRRHYIGQKITYDKKFTDDDGNIYYETVTEAFQKRATWRTLQGAKIDNENCPLDKWMHVAVEYDHAAQQFFVLYNGKWVKQAYNGGYTETGLNDEFIHKHILFDFPLEQYRLSIGWASGQTRKNGFIGAIDELRITNGVMRWPIPAEYYDISYVPNNEIIFTPPTSPSGADDLYVLHDQVSGGYIVNLDQNNKIKTFNIGSYQGTLKVISSHPDIATAAISNNVLTITGLSGGTSKIILYTLDTNSTVGNTVVFTVICNKNIPYVPLASATPAEIQDIITRGKAAEAWELGDTTADIKLSGTFNGSTINKTVKAILVDIDHNISIESGGKPNCHFLLSEPMDGQIASDKGVAWSQSPWKTRCTEIYNCMPTAWKNVIGTTVKYANDKGASYADDSAMQPFAEKVWLFTYFELSKKTNTSTTMSNDGFNQQYYPFMKLHAEDLADGTTLADGVWLRSRHKTANNTSRYVFKSGAGPTGSQLQACFGINGQ